MHKFVKKPTPSGINNLLALCAADKEKWMLFPRIKRKRTKDFHLSEPAAPPPPRKSLPPQHKRGDIPSLSSSLPKTGHETTTTTMATATAPTTTAAGSSSSLSLLSPSLSLLSLQPPTSIFLIQEGRKQPHTQLCVGFADDEKGIHPHTHESRTPEPGEDGAGRNF